MTLITFSTSGIITLTSGELSIANNGSLTINGASLIAVDGNSNDRVFNIESGPMPP